MRHVLLLVFCSALAACATVRPLPPSVKWEQRAPDLQHAGAWQMDGRAAVAVGKQGWQATLSWQQIGVLSEVHLSGPFGIGAMVLTQGPDGLSLNDAPPSEDALSQVEYKLGFALPIENLHYWLLGVPNPAVAAGVLRNDQDRAKSFTQAGWSIAYDRYVPVQGDLLPSLLVLSRDDVRVRIIIDHWDWPK